MGLRWNYQIVYHDEDDPPWYGVHEVYHDDDGGVSWTADPVNFSSENASEIVMSVETVLEDLKFLPVLVLSELQQDNPPRSP